MTNTKKKPCNNIWDNSLIETVFIPKGEITCKTITDNVIVFFMTGTLKYKINGLEEAKGEKGDLIFVPIGSKVQYAPTDDAVIMMLKIKESIVLSDYIPHEVLFSGSESKNNCNRSKSLCTTSRMWRVLNEIDGYVNERRDSKELYELKIKELLIVMRIYFSLEELKNFFLNISERDTYFSGFINNNWGKYTSIEEFAKAMNMSVRQFNTRLKFLSGMTPAKWLIYKRADNLYRSIRYTDKPFEQIYEEEGFKTLSQFNKFCKGHIGRTPSEIRNIIA